MPPTLRPIGPPCNVPGCRNPSVYYLHDTNGKRVGMYCTTHSRERLEALKTVTIFQEPDDERRIRHD